MGKGTVSRPSKSPPMKMIRFCDCVELGLGVCSNAVRREVYRESGSKIN